MLCSQAPNLAIFWLKSASQPRILSGSRPGQMLTGDMSAMQATVEKEVNRLGVLVDADLFKRQLPGYVQRRRLAECMTRPWSGGIVTGAAIYEQVATWTSDIKEQLNHIKDLLAETLACA
eukprot:1151376-Pelagomonas_calceolata.AAC.5